MTDVPWARLQKANDALMSRQYLPESRRLGPLRLAWHPKLGESEWNRIRVVEEAPHLETWLRVGLDHLKPHGGGCVEVGPESSSQLRQILRRALFRPLFRHAWVLYDTAPQARGNLPEPDSHPAMDAAPELEIVELPEASDDDFRRLFEQGFAAATPHGLEANWDRALTSILQQEAISECPLYGRTQCVHCVASWQGEAVAVASLGVHRGLAGLYNLAVLPRFRSRGIGRALTHYRLHRAHGLGAPTAFLQTREPRVLQWHLHLGARPGAVVSGWLPPEDF